MCKSSVEKRGKEEELQSSLEVVFNILRFKVRINNNLEEFKSIERFTFT